MTWRSCPTCRFTTSTRRPSACRSDRVHHRAGDRQLVHQVLYASSVRSSAIVSSISAIAWSTAGLEGGREPQPEVLDLARLAGHDHDLAGPAADRAHEAQHGRRVHAVRVDRLAVLDRRRDILEVGLDHVERARLAALARDVDQHQRVVAAHDLVGEVEPARAEVHHRHARRQLARLQPLRDDRAEAVVLHPRVADARRRGSASRTRAHALHLARS